MAGNWTAPAPHGSSAGTSQLAKHPGPPYASTNAIVGGEPTPSIDDPIAAVLLVLFLISAAAHLAILRVNKRRGLKFVFSGMLFALCLLRGVSLAARMVWASYPRAVNCVIAASVMTQCGSVLIFVVNLFFAQRVLRAYHPRLGWSRAATLVVWFLIACVMCCLVMAIATTIHTFFTLDRAARRADRAVQLFAGCYLAFLAFLPVPVVAIAAACRPRSTNNNNNRFRVEKFGCGRWRAKVGLLVFAALVATLGAAFRVGVNFDGRPGTAPAWFHSRACYYGFNFVTDLVVSTAYLLARFDRRFIVPDGARGPGEYSPIIPSTHSNSSHLEGKLPLMGTSKPAIMLRQPSSPSSPPSPPSSPPHTITTTAKQPSSSSSSQQHLIESFTDTSNTAVENTPTLNRSLNRKDKDKDKSARPNLHLTLRYHTHNHSYAHLHNYTHTHSSKPRPKSALKVKNNSSSGNNNNTNTVPRPGLKARTRRAAILRMRINSEADAYGPDNHNHNNDDLLNPSSPPPSHSPCGSREALVPRIASRQDSDGLRAPAPVHLVGPPILPDLDLDLELLSATLPWALDSWGCEVRRSSRGGSGSGSGSGAVPMQGTEGNGRSNSNSSSNSSSSDRSASNNSVDESGRGQRQGREGVEAGEVNSGSGRSSGAGSQRSMRSWRSRTIEEEGKRGGQGPE
ncbi:uncharacterized protein F4807DRAFT_459213 [Annulohypoxylon truncatum]|uniref:uncharacterized protein n=1 Tax=Annulohypoxylon truncatum TaxID=327061 RepID=UPI002007246E|nr:uncharacterized protein F4807DRAFT_459213 [Annulohypoxylon truncatum]KAI1210984.1 hypothetical protein F4807DRAFT_459213 [Annulohypoxylon truncatum]